MVIGSFLRANLKFQNLESSGDRVIPVVKLVYGRSCARARSELAVIPAGFRVFVRNQD